MFNGNRTSVGNSANMYGGKMLFTIKRIYSGMTSTVIYL